MRTQSGNVAGYITVEVAGQQHVIQIGEPTDGFRSSARWHLTRRIVVRKAKPLWSRADGRPMRGIRKYRRRQFTDSGALIGRPVDLAFRVELWADLPQAAEGVRAKVVIYDCEVTAHKYTSRWGRVKSVEEEPTDIGRLLPSTVRLRAGRSKGSVLAKVNREGEWSAPSRRVVRLAGRAFGLSCRYRVALEGCGSVDDGPGRAGNRILLSPSPPRPELPPRDRLRLIRPSPGRARTVDVSECPASTTGPG